MRCEDCGSPWLSKQKIHPKSRRWKSAPRDFFGPFSNCWRIIRRVLPVSVLVGQSVIPFVAGTKFCGSYFFDLAICSILQFYSHFILETKNFFSWSVCVWLDYYLLFIVFLLKSSSSSTLRFFPFFLITQRFTVLILSNAIKCYGQ